MAAPSTILSVGAARQKAEAEAQAASQNAYINTVNAGEALKQAQEQERQQRVTATKTIGNERATYGASGVSSASGSALDVLMESAKNAELDALNIRHAGEMKAWGYQMGAAMDTASAENAKIAGQFGVATALVNGGTQAAGQAMRAGA